MSEDQTRFPFSALRAGVPERDDQARERARSALVKRIASARSERAPRRHTRRARWLVSVGAAAVLAGAGATLAALLLRTEHTGHLQVFAASGALSSRFHVGARGSGHCWTDALATEARDAYRCFEGNAIHDPCFAATPHTHTVACFLDPWHPVTLLRLTRPLPVHSPVPTISLPWAIITTDGRHCTFLTGATAPMGGERINYGCIGGAYLIGTPNRRNPLWTIRLARRYVPDRPGRPTPIARFPLVGIKETVP